MSTHPSYPFNPIHLSSLPPHPSHPPHTRSTFPPSFPAHLLYWPYPSPPLSPNGYYPMGHLPASLLTTPLASPPPTPAQLSAVENLDSNIKLVSFCQISLNFFLILWGDVRYYNFYSFKFLLSFFVYEFII